MAFNFHQAFSFNTRAKKDAATNPEAEANKKGFFNQFHFQEEAGFLTDSELNNVAGGVGGTQGPALNRNKPGELR